MLLSYSRLTQAMTVFSFSTFLTVVTIHPVHADYNSYVPTNADSSAYTLSFSASDENNYNVMTYEKENNQWLKRYYEYGYQIKGCPGNNCSSGNAITVDKNGANVDADFYGLSKGAINNNEHTMGNVTGDFLNNKSNYGGAITNHEDLGTKSQMGDITGDFINNTSTAYGGAISNRADVSGQSTSSAIIGNITGNFIGNNSGFFGGGAIYNNSNSNEKIAKIGNITGDFIANKAADAWGGAIYNIDLMGNIKGDFVYNTAEDGGAIMNTGTIDSITGDFIANTATGYGGALYLTNYATTGKIRGDFIGNTAVRSGGAILNSTTKDFDVSGNFVENSGRYGGAIFNSSNSTEQFPTTAVISNSNFINNSAEKLGGAIYHEGQLDIVANNYASVFQGNTAAGASNAMYVGNDEDSGLISEVNLIAEDNGSISFYDDIDGDEGYKLNLSGTDDSQINFHADIHNGDITVNTASDTRASAEAVNVIFDNINNISNKNNSFIMQNGTVTFDDLALDQHNFREIKMIGGEVNINHADVDLANKVMGRLKSDTNSGGTASIKVHNLDLISDGSTYNAVDFADTAFSGQVENHVTSALGPVYNYAVDYLPGTGQFTFQRAAINDEVQVPSYAAIAAVSVLSDEIYSRVLADADTYFTADSTQKEVKPFAKIFGSDDNIDLKHYSGGKAKFYGAIAGFESSPIALSSDWKAVYNAYLAYAQGEHKFSDQRVDQETGYAGVSGIWYKNKFFIGSTVNAAIMENKAREFGEENKFTSYLGGLGLKTGYNFDLGADYVLQPNLYGSYTYINSNDYKTKRGARVKFDDMANFELAPGLKLSKKFAEGLEMYLKGRYDFVFNEDQHATANDVLLPELELKNYAEFGVGFEKNMQERNLSYFAEFTRREGGREGWNGLAGLKWIF